MNMLSEKDWSMRWTVINRITDGLRHKFYRAHLGTGGYAGEEVRTTVPPEFAPDDANLISSELAMDHDLHTVVLDIDFPVHIVPSSTPGHFHLFITKAIRWEQYQKLLDVMAEIGLLEPGYVEASKRRGGTHVRLPWVRKSNVNVVGEHDSTVA